MEYYFSNIIKNLFRLETVPYLHKLWELAYKCILLNKKNSTRNNTLTIFIIIYLISFSPFLFLNLKKNFNVRIHTVAKKRWCINYDGFVNFTFKIK